MYLSNPKRRVITLVKPRLGDHVIEFKGKSLYFSDLLFLRAEFIAIGNS